MQNLLRTVFLLHCFFAIHASADSSIEITDQYSCTRLADGKLHITKQTATGFQIIKNKAAEATYTNELKRIANRIDLLDGFKIKVQDGLNLQEIRKLINLLRTGEGEGELSSREKALAAIGRAVATAKARRATVKIYLKQLEKCQKQKFPGLDALGAVVLPIYVRGTTTSSLGYLISVPKPSGDARTARLCLSYLDLFTPAGLPPEKAANLVTFANNICTFSPALTGNGVIDCVGPVQKGFLSFYLRKIQLFERSPDPNSDTVINSLAQLASIGSGFGFNVQSVSKATGSECEKLR